MKTSKALIAIALLTGLHATASAQEHHPHGADAGKSRAQVRAELMAAIAHGDMIAEHESGKRHRDIRPDLYPKHDSGVGKTRTQVVAEWQEAKRLGMVTADGESGVLMKDLYPHRYPTSEQKTATRAEVIAALKEAQRTGDLLANGESGLKFKDLFLVTTLKSAE